jgi:uncharacterized membrane protein
MTATIATSPWSPLRPGDASVAPLIFGREVALGAAPGAPRALQWLFARNCSVSPRQLGRVYLSLCLVTLAVGGYFLLHGAPLVLAFAGLELLAIGAALLVFARHAGDREVLTLSGRRLQVEQQWGQHVQRADFAADWTSVEPSAAQGSLVQISSRGRTVRVGRHLRPELRAAFARELRRALRRPRAAAPDPDTEHTS